MPGWIHELFQPGVFWPVVVTFFIIYLILSSLKKNWKWLSKVFRFINELIGDEKTPGVVVRMDVMTKELKESNAKVDSLGAKTDANTVKLGSMETQMETVHHELTTNHGSSVKDATKRLEDQGAKTEKLLADHITETAHWSPMLSDLHQTWSNKPRNN